MTISCSKCGAAVEAANGFCTGCGAAASIAPAKPGGKSKPILIAVCILALVCTAGEAWVYARVPAKPAAVITTVSAAVAPPASAVTATGDAGKSKLCSLVSKEEMEQILGIKLKELAATETTCQYKNDEGYSADIDIVWQGGKKAMDEAKTYNVNLFDPVANLGDEAFFQAAGVMHVRRGDVYLVINSRVFPNERETETRIASKALANMK